MSQVEFKRRLKALMLRPENQVCADCPERQPRWASLIVPPPGAPPGSLKFGAFCCLECSGSHRRLGVHISFVRSINLDSWKEQEVLAMENGGNAKVNAIFEARLSVNKPTQMATGPIRERFIRDKYERRKFYDPNAFERVSQMQAAQEQEKVVSGVQRRLAGGSRKPSDAARKRVEERAARGGGTVRSVRTVKAPARKAAAPPPPAPAVDLLDFGDFASAEATSAVQASVAVAAPAPAAAPPAPPNKEPELDLFANMSVGNTPSGGVANGGGQIPPQQQGTPQQQAEQKKMSTADIMSMFNTPTAQHNPMQQNMFAMQGGIPTNGMTNNGMAGGMPTNGMANTGMAGGMPTNGVANTGMTGGMNANNNMGMMNNMNNNNMNPQQQQMGMMNNMQMMQMQQNRMVQQQGMGGNMGGNNMNQMGGNNMGMMGGQQGMGNMNMMQQQQGQMPQMNNMMAGNNNMMMMQQGGGGGMMQGGNQFGQGMGGMQQAQPSPQKRDQFADFGNFGR